MTLYPLQVAQSVLGKPIGMNPTSSTHHQIRHHLLNVDLMPARIFILSVIIIGIAFLALPAARYLIWGPELDIELVSVPDDSETGTVRELEIVRLLGKDAIPAILQPKFVSALEAEQWMTSEEAVLGISIDGEHKAYPVTMLSRHEIVNDVVGGEPVAVTW